MRDMAVCVIGAVLGGVMGMLLTASLAQVPVVKQCPCCEGGKCICAPPCCCKPEKK